MKRRGRIVAPISVGLSLLSPTLAVAQAHRVTAGHIPAVYRSITRKLGSSTIPVLVPTWLPNFHTKVYPGFYTFGRTAGTSGPGYGLDLYTSSTTQDHANEVAGIYGIAGDAYTVNAHTVPVKLGKASWAYIDPNPRTNIGYTITVVRAFTGAGTEQDFTYTIDRTCPDAGPTGKPSFACLEHVARSLAHYTASSMRTPRR